MKVLMFGWEFPPHISGGLGTACFGLTQSLVREKVDVLFVVPRLHGDERAKGTVLINASAVRRNGRNTLAARGTAASARATGAVRMPGEPAIIAAKMKSRAPFPEIGSHFVTFRGRVTHQKGPAFFVEAADKALREFPQAHFIVAGAGDLLPQMIERVAQLGMSANFHFTGFLSGDLVDQIWSMTDVYVMPSVSEPFGIAPLEAIQGGFPVILSNQSGVSEVMPHAIKVNFWDVKALAGRSAVFYGMKVYPTSSGNKANSIWSA